MLALRLVALAVLPLCWLFRAGHSIRVQITSSAFPKYDRNLNTGESLATGITMRRAQQRIYHDAEHPSHIVLPLVPSLSNDRQ